MRLSRSVMLVFAMAASVSQRTEAQGSEISLAVLPIGVLPTASRGSRAAPTVAEEVVAIVSQSGLYTVIDRSADRAIEQELRKAEGFRNFDSRVQLETTGRLNAKVLLIGVIEEATSEMRRPPPRSRERPTYEATLGLRVKLVRTETGELIKSAFFTLRNGTPASEVVKDNSVGRLIPKAVQEAVARQIDEKVSTEAARQNVELRAQTPDEAMRAAVRTLQKPLGEFLKTSHGAVVAASTGK
ncbi:MAG: hypothetical protein ACT4P7_24015 [Gemmatimonadaceae bacterium]